MFEIFDHRFPTRVCVFVFSHKMFRNFFTHFFFWNFSCTVFAEEQEGEDALPLQNFGVRYDDVSLVATYNGKRWAYTDTVSDLVDLLVVSQRDRKDS